MLSSCLQRGSLWVKIAQGLFGISVTLCFAVIGYFSAGVWVNSENAVNFHVLPETGNTRCESAKSQCANQRGFKASLR